MQSGLTNLAILNQDNTRHVFVLDTNVLLHDPTSIFKFEEHIVLIPLTAIEEIDNKKNDPIIGFNARDISIKLEHLSSNLSEDNDGVKIPNGKNGILIFLSDNLFGSFPQDLSLTYKDNLFLSQILEIKKLYPKKQVTFVTKDRNLRIKCNALGILCDDYKHDKISEESLASFFQPIKEIQLTTEEINEVFSTQNSQNWFTPYKRQWKLRENEGVVLRDPSNELFGMGVRTGNRINYFDYHSIRVLGMPPKVLDDKNYDYNFEQAICMHQSMDDNIRVQIIIGRAGTGKTHIAMAAALEKVLKEKRYDSIKLIKPIVTKSRLGEDIGFLPGSVRRKLIPKMRPFIEKLRQFSEKENILSDDGYNRLLDSGVIELINLADVRGADLANAIVIFDEAQNANPFQMRTLGTRLGEDTKLIVLGDPTQIDSIYLDKYSNALINLYLSSVKNPTNFLAQICLVQMVRSHTSQWFEKVIQVNQVKKK
jgi:PhoH-like ATPase